MRQPLSGQRHLNHVTTQHSKLRIQYIILLFILIISKSLSGWNDPMPTNVQFPGCNDNICEISRSKPVTTEFSFTAHRASQTAYASVEALLFGKWVSLARNSPICSKLTVGNCPLTVGGKYTYRGSNNVPSTLPAGIRSTLRIRATDDQQKTIACIQVIFKVVN